LKGEENTYDLIVLSHSLEHLLDPRNVLELILRSLRAGGLLYIEVPNIPRDTLLRFPDHPWTPRFDEPHIAFFSETVLRSTLEAAAFHLQFLSTAGPEYRHISSLQYRLPAFRSTVQRFMPGWLFHFLRRRDFTRVIRIKEREEAFYSYGGFRIWLRSIWKKA
jgi:SAM-dependent methyltransferase